MATVLLFHHALGLTQGVLSFADDLRRGGHVVHAPDLYAGRTFATIEAGVAHAQGIGFEALIESGVRTADALPADLVYAGFSLGVMPAEKLAITRPGARGALFFDACAPAGAFGASWPSDLPVQVHGMDADPYFVDEGDLDAARELVVSAARGELFLYPGDRHLFADDSLPWHDPGAAHLLTERALAFLASI